MEEFASSVLVEAVRRALSAQRIDVVSPVPTGAFVAFAAKRRFLTTVAQTHGLVPLLRAGLSLPTLSKDPAVAALGAARDPVDLFDRWHRLEQFLHSRHRVVVREHGPRHVVAEHVGLHGTSPVAAEDAVVLGVLTTLLAHIGVQDLTVRLGDSPAGTPAPAVFSKGIFVEPPRTWATATWQFRWASYSLRQPPVRDTGCPPDRDVASRVRRLIDPDPGRRWSVGGLAAEVGISTRSLQRHLVDVGGFRELVASARVEAAADLLMNSGHPLAIVGFACGFADQPHFTRSFRRRTNMTPTAYRSSFGRTVRTTVAPHR